MNIGLAIGTGLFVLSVLLGIAQLWFNFLDPLVFIKLEMTIGALILIVFAVWFVNKESREDKINSSGEHLDG
jgi:SNF family Na+-dependent transporter